MLSHTCNDTGSKDVFFDYALNYVPLAKLHMQIE